MLSRLSTFLLAVLGLALLGPGACGGPSGPPDRELVVALAASPQGLDPAAVTDSESIDVLELVFEHLVRHRKGSMNVEPSLATRWERQADGRTWRFFLRSGVRFHDGTPCDADAVVYSITRQSGGARTPEGRPRYPYWSSYYRNITSVERESKLVVRIMTDRPFAPLLASLAMFPVSVVSPREFRAAEKENRPPRPVGTGPFRFVSRDEASGRITLAAFGKYWGPRPGVSRVVFRRMSDSRQRLRALMVGDVHIARDLEPELLQIVRLHPDLRLAEMPANNVVYLALNTENPPFHDPRIRWAVNHAIRKDPIIGLVYQELAQRAIGPLPPFMSPYYTKDLQVYEYSPTLARRYLREAGYDPAVMPKLFVMDSPRPYLPKPVTAARMIARDLQAVGMPVEVKVLPWSQHKRALAAGQHHLALHGWSADSGDPDNFLYNLLDSDNAVSGNGLNYAFYKSFEFHKLVTLGREGQSTEDRVRYYHEAQKIMARSAPWVPLVHAKVGVALRREVRGFDVHPSTILDLRSVSLR